MKNYDQANNLDRVIIVSIKGTLQEIRSVRTHGGQ